MYVQLSSSMSTPNNATEMSVALWAWCSCGGVVYKGWDDIRGDDRMSGLADRTVIHPQAPASLGEGTLASAGTGP